MPYRRLSGRPLSGRPLAGRNLAGQSVAPTQGQGGGAWWEDYTDLALEFGARYMIDGVSKSFSDLTFARASTAEVIQGGSRVAFASGAPRIVSNVLTLDGGVTNGLSQPEDQSNAAWTKTNVTVGASINLGGGTVPFWPVLETVTNGAHSTRADVTSTNTDWLGLFFVYPGLGRTKGRIDIVGSTTGSGARFIFDFTGAGSVTSAVAVGGAPGTVLGSGIKLLSDGVYMFWGIARFANSSHTAARMTYTQLDDASANSYAGDITKGMYIGPVMLANVADFRSYAATTRAAETLGIPLTDGDYSFRVRDDVGNDEWRGMVAVTGSSYDLVPVSGSSTITKVEGYRLDYMHDFSGDADTLDGDIGAGWDLRGPYVASYPLPAATKGRISTGKVVADQGDVLYATRVLSSPIHHMETVVSWSDTGGGGAEASFAMFATADPDIINNMPHHTLDRNQMYIGKRENGEFPIPVLATYNFSPNPAEDGTQVQFRHSTTIDGAVVESIRNSERQTYQAAQFADAGVTPVGTRGVWEIFQSDVAAGNTIRIHKVGARYRPVILAA